MNSALSTASMDHRWGARREAALEVALLTPENGMLMGRIGNISMSGALILTRFSLPILTLLQVIPLGTARTAPQAGHLYAYVVREDERGLGVEWWNLEPAVIRELLG